MSKQQEDYKKLASDVLGQAQRETGPYRDVLLGVAEAYAALALHQGVFDDWARTFPVRPLARGEPPPQSAARSEPPVPSAVRGAPPAQAPVRSASATLASPALGRQANQNGKTTRPSAAA